jgi:transcriptional regulator with XRE-family HTH domain
MLQRHLDATQAAPKEVAEGLGVSRATISRWLSGEDVPAERRAPALADCFGLDVADVVLALYESRNDTSEPRQLQDGMWRQLRLMDERLSGLEDTVAELRQLLRRLTK